MDDSSMPSLALTFVFPCLNEEGTLRECVTAVRRSLEQLDAPFEIVVADNGSTDRSREIAVEEGCRVVPVPARGYGAALRGGIEAAYGEYVMFADSDMTYMYEHAAPLYEAAKKADAGMAIASRMIGEIEPGAMPTLHRTLGTPVLTGLINLLFDGKLTDCNSGFRCVRKTEYLKWNIRSSGMEFASELLIKSLKAKTKTVEIPSGLRCGPPDRVAHLRTWRDGMRHLLFILSEKPAFFEGLGLLLAVPATILQVISGFTGPVEVAGLNVFDVHSQALLLLFAILGTQLYVFASSLYLRSKDQPLAVTRRMISMNEGVLFFLLLGVLAGCTALVVTMLIVWAQSGFAGLHQANSLLVVVHVVGVAVMVAIGMLSVHTLKKSHSD